MKKIILGALFLSAINAGSALAASQDECAIWLCLPQGFAPPECAGPRSAMTQRIHKGKSPLPKLSNCGGDDDNSSKVVTGFAALIPEHEKCEKWDNDNNCLKMVTVPEKYLRNVSCHEKDGETVPKGCSRTYKFVEVSLDNVVLGSTYYY